MRNLVSVQGLEELFCVRALGAVWVHEKSYFRRVADEYHVLEQEVCDRGNAALVSVHHFDHCGEGDLFFLPPAV